MGAATMQAILHSWPAGASRLMSRSSVAKPILAICPVCLRRGSERAWVAISAKTNALKGRGVIVPRSR